MQTCLKLTHLIIGCVLFFILSGYTYLDVCSASHSYVKACTGYIQEVLCSFAPFYYNFKLSLNHAGGMAL